MTQGLASMAVSGLRRATALAAVAALALCLSGLPAAPARAADADFAAWLQHFRSEAAAKGISRKTVSHALAHVEFIPHVIELDRKQLEFTLTFAEYIERLVSPTRVDRGREMREAHKALLARVAERYGVAPSVVLALWGIESDFGRLTGDYPVVGALATLAYDGRRAGYFRGELLDALRILDRGYADLDSLKGSWAGAMGQSQFMPSSYLRYAVDFEGNGRRDIWRSTPDVLASIANYMSQVGWTPHQGWGMEVRLPQSFDHNQAATDSYKPAAEWARLGVQRADGTPLPSGQEEMAIVEPDGAGGLAYAVTGNFHAIMRWNHSVYFAAAVGLLADQIAE
jgi:membrane-bound lytic murein transglycosylase B